MITQVHHIAMIVSSERVLEFYKLLGFTESFRKERKYDVAVLMYGHGMQLEIFVDERHPTRYEVEVESTGLRHFALQVDGKLETEMERLKAESQEVLSFGPIMEDWRSMRFCFLKDPDGAVIELHE